MIVNNILSRVLLGILTGCCLLACRGELPVLPSDEIDVGKDPLGGVSIKGCLLYTSPSPRDAHESRMPSSA